MDSSQKVCKVYLPLLTAADGSTPHSPTGFTSNRMMLGRETYSCMLPTLMSSDAHKEFAETLGERLDHELAWKLLQTAQVKQKRIHDLSLRDQTCSVGDLVYVRDSAKGRVLSPKLQAPWKDPCPWPMPLLEAWS